MIRLHLAPMEGVVDSYTRDLLTSLGGIDQTVTEFIRVTDHTMPDFVFLREVPELLNDSRTPAGTPLVVQLLGGDPFRLAEHAMIAVRLGARGIDLNFGCPAKTVNRHDGGASLLAHPDRIRDIVRTVRESVPEHLPVTAKIRLGFSDPSDCLVNARAVQEGGANAITIHCRTKMDMYKPPAYWEWIPRIKERIQIPIIANGEIFSKENFEECLRVTECDQFMIGRGAIIDPFVFCKIKGLPHDSSWPATLALVRKFFLKTEAGVSPFFAQARTKQWLRELAKGEYSLMVKPLFDQLKIITKPPMFKEALFTACSS